MAVSQANRKDLRRVAAYPARMNADSEPAMRMIYWSPSDDEVRLVEVDESLPELDPDGLVAPFYFRSDPVGGIPYRTAIAAVGTGDPGQSVLP